MRKLWQCALATVALGLVVRPAAAQTQENDRWYWGGQVGVIMYQTVDAAAGTIRGRTTALTFGGHWLITKHRVGLYMAYDHTSFKSGTTSAFTNPASLTGFTDVSFRNMQRIQASVFAMPTPGPLQPYLGLGLAIQNVTDAVSTVAPTSVTEAGFITANLPDASAKAFAVITGGFQWQMGRIAWFGQYQYQPGAGDFLLRNAQHTFLGGLRYALSAAHEDVGTDNNR